MLELLSVIVLPEYIASQFAVPDVCIPAVAVTATLPLIDLCGSALRKFGSILQYASALSIDALTDGSVCISLNVPDVYVPKTSS